jgi:hypothetical protein
MNIKICGAVALWLVWYATAYYGMVVPHHVFDDSTPPFDTLFVEPRYRVPGGETVLLIPFFWLAHLPDRFIRPDIWDADLEPSRCSFKPPVNPPAPADDPPEISN